MKTNLILLYLAIISMRTFSADLNNCFRSATKPTAASPKKATGSQTRSLVPGRIRLHCGDRRVSNLASSITIGYLSEKNQKKKRGYQKRNKKNKKKNNTQLLQCQKILWKSTRDKFRVALSSSTLLGAGLGPFPSLFLFKSVEISVSSKSKLKK